MKLEKSDVLIMALATGFIVANIYYGQPLIVLIAKDFNISESLAGHTAYLTQAGYAAGLLFMVPLGDRLERKKQILFTTVLAVISLIIAALAKNFIILEIACFLIGFSSMVTQLILPLAAHLSAPEQRGRVVGTVMSGLLIGILASRTLSGFIGEIYGWRTMYWIAAVICSMIIVLIYYRFPTSKPDFKGSYLKLMHSITDLIKTEPVLRECSAINFFVFMVFGSFWTNMVLLLSNAPYHFKSDQIGLFGLVGVAGASVAPLVGRLGDKTNPRIPAGFGLVLLLIGQTMVFVFDFQLYAFIAGIILLESGQQMVHISNQTRIYALNASARNRLNTVLMTMSFIGAALGSAIGLALWDLGRWNFVSFGSIIMIISALLIYLFTYKKSVLQKA
ncbi:MAG: MFS transporter [Sphingobacteriales bacterium]|nr:MFS transporter [Sphingobacteriales bacterium]